MRIFGSGLAAAALVSLSIAGCKTAAGENKSAGDEPAEPAASPEVAIDDAVVEAGIKLMEDMAAIMRANADDCDKVAAELTPFFETNKDGMLAFNALMESYSPEQQEEIANAYMQRMVDVMDPLMEIGTKCENNANFKKAMSALNPEAEVPENP